jgi:putative transposase
MLISTKNTPAAGNKTSKRIARLAHKRNMKVADYLHKVSAYIRAFCIEHQIGTVIVGKNKGWKYQINLGKQVNQKFTFLPFNKLLHQFTYKLDEVGITVIFQEESHTSKCDHLSGETIGHHTTYSGKRLKRGLFQSATGQLINADVNGAIGIGIKAVGNVFLERLLDTGVVLTLVRINIFW